MESGTRRPVRVLLAKPGLDGHDRGVKVIMHALREAGMEVIYTGLRQSVDQVAAAALQENPDVIGLSILSGAYMGIARKLMARIEAEGMTEVSVIIGGNIRDQDAEALLSLGVAAVFHHHARLEEIVRFIRESVPAG
ncbi:MAG: cobalamin-dependent protein [Anaerolineales bacterium]|jgi:methylmalonyl-CoA mutase C-terminal domain/subunit|nr:cobalamin-dependent protein [Anaerolineales bacterium]